MENQKRTADINAGEDEDCDDKKIEEFFALVRNFKDVKNQLNDRSKRRKSESDADDHHRRSAGAWVPAFQWQDFTTEVEFRKPNSDLPPPCERTEEEIIKKDDEVNGSSGLDLKLTL